MYKICNHTVISKKEFDSIIEPLCFSINEMFTLGSISQNTYRVLSESVFNIEQDYYFSVNGFISAVEHPGNKLPLEQYAPSMKIINLEINNLTKFIEDKTVINFLHNTLSSLNKNILQYAKKNETKRY